MEIKINVEKGAIPDDDFFAKIWKIVKTHGWYLSNGDEVVIDDIRMTRNYSSLELTKLIGEDSENTGVLIK